MFKFSNPTLNQVCIGAAVGTASFVTGFAGTIVARKLIMKRQSHQATSQVLDILEKLTTALEQKI